MTDKNQFYRNFSNRKPYNKAVKCKKGEILAPFVTTYENARFYEMDLDNLETWHFGTKKIIVGFTPVEASKFDVYMKLFNQDVAGEIARQTNPNWELSGDDSLDALMDTIDDPDKCGTDPTGTTENEDIAELYRTLDLLIDYMARVDNRKADALRMLSEGYSKKEVTETVTPELKKSRAYEFFKDTQDEALKILREKLS